MTATPTPSLAFQNFYEATLSSDITATDTDIFLDVIPNGSQGFLVIDPDNSTGREVIFYTSKTATKVVCPSVADGRGQDDTSAGVHLQGTTVIMAPVSAFFEALQSGLAMLNSSITPEKLLASTGTTWVWQSWTPTLSGRFDDTKWTKTCKYIQIGKTVHYRMKLVANAATPMSGGTTDAQFSLPVTAAAGYAGGDQTAWIGGGGVYDNGTSVFQADAYLSSSSDSTGRIRVHTTAGALNAITSTVPMTWANTDEINISGTYEAA